MKYYENDIGQKVYPGDPVVVVASGYSHSVRIHRGVFIGWTEAGQLQCRVVDHVWDSTAEKIVPGSRIGTYPLGRIFKIDTANVDFGALSVGGDHE